MNITGYSIIKFGLITYTIFACIGISGIQLGLWIAILGILAVFLSRKKLFFYFDSNSKKIFFILIIFVIWNFFVTLLGLEPVRGLKKLLEFVGPIFFVIAFLNFENNSDETKFVNKLVNIMILFCVLESLYGVLQYFTGIDFTHKIKMSNHRIRGTLGYYNSLGGVLGMMISFIYGNFIFKLSKTNLKEKLFFLISFVISSFALILTFTRGAWLGVSFGIFLITVYKFKWRVIFLVLIFPLLLTISPIRERLRETISNPHAGRKELWEWSIEFFKKKPITGYGFSSYQKLLSGKNIYYAESHFHAHNVYLNTMVESGVIGLILLIFIKVLLLKYVFFLINKTNSSLVYGILGGLIDFYIHSMVDNVLWGETLYMFWFFVGLLFFVSKSSKLKNEQKQTLFIN